MPNTNAEGNCVNPQVIDVLFDRIDRVDSWFDRICQHHLPLTASFEHPHIQSCFTMFKN